MDLSRCMTMRSRTEMPMERGMRLLGGWEITKRISQNLATTALEVRRAGRTCVLCVTDIPRDAQEAMDIQDIMESRSAYEQELARMAEEAWQRADTLMSLRGTAGVLAVEEVRMVRFTQEAGWRLLVRTEMLPSLADQMRSRLADPDEAMRMARQLAEVLLAFEQRGFTHRSIRPENIFVTPEGNFRLGDLGGFPITGSMTVRRGLMMYAQPESAEVLQRPDLDAQGDRYALALVIYRLLNGGRMPFEGPGVSANAAVLQRMQGKEIPPIEGLHPVVNRFLCRALHPDMDQRYPDARAFLWAVRVAEKCLSCPEGQPVRVDASVLAGTTAAPSAQAAEAVQPVQPEEEAPAAEPARDLITFGMLLIDGEIRHLTWRVIAQEKGRVLLLCDQAIETRAYGVNPIYKRPLWQKAPLRVWLQDTFYKAAFNALERGRMLNVRLDNGPRGMPTMDTVFLLSKEEVERYLPDARERQAEPSAHAARQGAVLSDGRHCRWWLRGPIDASNRCPCVQYDGAIIQTDAEDTRIGVRPAFWMKWNG